jgi:hypothetical protein
MRKQAYLHVHALLLAVARHLHDCDGMPESVLDEYDALGVRPWSVQLSKQAHHDAVLALAAAVEAWTRESAAAESREAEPESVTR